MIPLRKASEKGGIHGMRSMRRGSGCKRLTQSPEAKQKRRGKTAQPKNEAKAKRKGFLLSKLQIVGLDFKVTKSNEGKDLKQEAL